MSISLPPGFRAAGVHCGLKRNPNKQDICLIVADGPCAAAGVYTQNQVFAAPVKYNRARTPSAIMRAVVVNSGNANACTGARGDEDCARMAELAATAAGVKAEEVLVLSTGIIGEFLPMEKIGDGIRRAAESLAADEETLITAARGMMTTDTVHKLAQRTFDAGGKSYHITGLAKGAAMVGPNMATMLGIVLTNAPIDPGAAHETLKSAADQSFNCISVDGHMSTNDTVLLLAGGEGEPLSGEPLSLFSQAVAELCMDLAQAIIHDAEGATHCITIDVQGCRTVSDARAIAKTVAESPLVKTAVAGGDPNWGRIVSAAGYAPVRFNPQGVKLTVNGTLLYEQGSPAPFNAKAVSESIRAERETSIVLEFVEGEAAARFWSSDLTQEYVRLNADYHT